MPVNSPRLRIPIYSSRDLPVLLLFGLAAFVLLWRLGQASLHNWDEAIYAQIAKEILLTGDWITLHWGFQYWIDKPPLLMWITASLFKWFGVTEFWARAASAFSGIGLVLTTFLIGKHLYNRQVGLFSALLLLTSFDFVKWSRNGMLDVMLALLSYLALYGYIKSAEGNRKWWYFIGISVGLAILLKGLAAFIAPITLLLVLIFNGRLFTVLRSRDFWIGVGLAVVIAAPWHILMYLQFGMEFLEKYFAYQISYATSVLDRHSGNVFFYIEKIGAGFAPWSLLAIFALWSGLKENLAGQTRSRILLTVTALVFLVYTVAETKLSTYAIPVYPALSILTAAMLFSYSKVRRTWVMAVAALGFCLMILFTQRALQAMLILGAAGLAMVFLGLLMKRVGYSAATAIVGGLIVGSMMNVGPLYLEGQSPLARLAPAVASAAEAGQEPLIIYSNLWAPVALYYFDRPIHEVRDPETLAGLVGTHSRDIILWKEDSLSLAKSFQVTVLDEKDFLVYGRIER